MIFPQPAPSFDEPVEMLAACHGRIEAQLSTLERLVPHLAERGADAAAQEAARAVMRYFDTAGVNHHRDEELDLFPLLRAERAVDAAVLDGLERDHAAMLEAYGVLKKQLEGVAAGNPDLDADEVTRFAALYRRHMALEEREVLPAAREALAGRAGAEVGGRMAARRKAGIVR